MVNIERKNLKKRKSKGSHIKRYGIDFYVSKITQAGDTQPPAEVVPEYARLSSRRYDSITDDADFRLKGGEHL